METLSKPDSTSFFKFSLSPVLLPLYQHCALNGATRRRGLVSVSCFGNVRGDQLKVVQQFKLSAINGFARIHKNTAMVLCLLFLISPRTDD